MGELNKMENKEIIEKVLKEAEETFYTLENDNLKMEWAIEKALAEKDKEINSQIELARQSGYNEACFIKDKELKEIEEEIDNYSKGKGSWYKYYIKIKDLKEIFAKHNQQFDASDEGNICPSADNPSDKASNPTGSCSMSDGNLICECNHPEESHFNQEYKCAECDCQAFEPKEVK